MPFRTHKYIATCKLSKALLNMFDENENIPDTSTLLGLLHSYARQF